MKISTLLMKPFLMQLEREFSDLEHHVLSQDGEEALELKTFIRSQQDDLRYLRDWIFRLETLGEHRVPAEFHKLFRKLKLDLRFAHRKWLRILSNEARTRRLNERRGHVSTFAA